MVCSTAKMATAQKVTRLSTINAQYTDRRSVGSHIFSALFFILSIKQSQFLKGLE